tara:strand:- start:1927 stop:3156 length:1230 start_codon:yes stop_codon:yes gene_type:complete
MSIVDSRNKISLLKNFKVPHTVKIILVILFVVFMGESLSLSIKEFLYTLSILIKSFFLFLIPFILLSCILTIFQKGIANIFKMSFLAASLILVNNFCVGLLAYSMNYSMGSMEKAQDVTAAHQTLNVLWPVNFVLPIDNLYVVGFAFCLVLIKQFYKSVFIEKFQSILEVSIRTILEKFFLPIIPVFVLGIALKAQHEGIFDDVSKYLYILVLVVSFQVIYLIIMYLLASNFNIKTFFHYIRNSLYSGIVGFTSCSGYVALPLTLKAAIKNTKDEKFSNFIVPFTLNLNLSGDSIAIPVIALAIISGFHMPEPSLGVFCLFILYHSAGRFISAAIPGGTLFITVAILENQLGFSPEMMAILIAGESIFDPFVTMTNVLGNGAFAIICKNIVKYKSRFFNYLDETMISKS